MPKKLFISLLLFSILFSSIVFASKASDEPKVELVSKDKQKFRVKRKVILQSGLIKDMLEEQEEEYMPSIPVPNVESGPLKKLIKLLDESDKIVADKKKRDKEGAIVDIIQRKKYTPQDYFELINAFHYLNVDEHIYTPLLLSYTRWFHETIEKKRDEARKNFEIEEMQRFAKFITDIRYEIVMRYYKREGKIFELGYGVLANKLSQFIKHNIPKKPFLFNVIKQKCEDISKMTKKAMVDRFKTIPEGFEKDIIRFEYYYQFTNFLGRHIKIDDVDVTLIGMKDFVKLKKSFFISEPLEGPQIGDRLTLSVVNLSQMAKFLKNLSDKKINLDNFINSALYFMLCKMEELNTLEFALSITNCGITKIPEALIYLSDMKKIEDASDRRLEFALNLSKNKIANIPRWFESVFNTFRNFKIDLQKNKLDGASKKMLENLRVSLGKKLAEDEIETFKAEKVEITDKVTGEAEARAKEKAKFAIKY